MKKCGFLILVCVSSSSAAALETLGPYPDRSAPADVAVAPRNTKLWVFGIAPPSADNVGVQVTYDVGTAVLQNFQPLGDTGFVVDPNEALSFAFIEGDNVEYTFRSNGPDEIGGTFAVGPDDNTKPTLDEALVVSLTNGVLTVAATGSDDVGLAAVFARREGLLIAATAVGTTLRAPGPCFEVSVVDLAQNESPGVTVCDTDLVLAADDTPTEGSCGSAPAEAGLVGALVLARRRKRRARHA